MENLSVEKNNNENIVTDLNDEKEIIKNDELIIKTPNIDKNIDNSSFTSFKEIKIKNNINYNGDIFWLSVLHIFFGFFMIGFGIYAVLHEAAMALSLSGIWTGLITISTGIFGILSTAKRCCPIEDKWRKISQTLFLALSLISIALSQLVVVICSIGLARDINNTENEEENPNIDDIKLKENSVSKFSIIIPENYLGIMANAALIIISSIECICALISSYKGAKTICSCFHNENYLYTGLPVNTNNSSNNSHALVNSWLGNTQQPQIYVVSSHSPNMNNKNKISGGLPLTPIFTYPPQIVGVPLIPAPLGTIPPPPSNKKVPNVYGKYHQQKKYQRNLIEKTPRLSRSRSRSKSKSEDTMTEKDVAKTYTGLDKEIAEQFIERCDKQKTNDCSISSKTSCDNSSSGPSSAIESTTNSKDFLVK